MRKADNFDPSKWLVENKITTQSKLNEGVVSAPLSNLEWKLDPKVKKYTNVSSTEEALSFIESLTDEELNNLYTWRLGFNIPQSKDEKIKNLLDEFTRNQDTLFGQNNLNENKNPVMLGVGDQITPDMLKNPSKFDFPMKIVSFSNDGSGDTVRVKRILKKKGMFGGEKEVEDTFEDLVDNWEKIHLKPTVKMSSQTEIDF